MSVFAEYLILRGDSGDCGDSGIYTHRTRTAISNLILDFLLPYQRDPETLEKLRDSKPREPLKTRTEKLKKSCI